MSQYKVYVKNKALSSTWILPVNSGLIDYRLNNVHSGTVYIGLRYLIDYLAKQGTNPKELFESGFMNMYIEQDDALIFAGYISDVRYKKYAQAANCEVGFKSWLGYFENRYYSGSFTTTDQGTIAWTALNAVNDIGITAGTIDTTTSHTKTFNEDDVAKIVKNFSKDNIADGFDFDISHAKVLTIKDHIGVSRPEVQFVDGRNIKDADCSVKLVGSVFTDGKILGGGIGEDQIVRTYDAGAGYETAWHKQEALINDVNVENTAILDGKIQKYVEKHKSPIRVVSFKTLVSNPSFQSYAVGDDVKVKIPDYSIDDMLRVRKKTLYFGQDEYVNLEFSFDE